MRPNISYTDRNVCATDEPLISNLIIVTWLKGAVVLVSKYFIKYVLPCGVAL